MIGMALYLHYVVNANSINCFKSLLDSHLANSRFIFV